MQIKGTVSFQKHSRGSLFPKNISDLATPCNIQLLSVTKKEYFKIALFTFCSQLMDGICTCPHKYLSILIYLITFCICHPHIFRHNMAEKQDKLSLLRNPQHSTCKHTFWTLFHSPSPQKLSCNTDSHIKRRYKLFVKVKSAISITSIKMRGI